MLRWGWPAEPGLGISVLVKPPSRVSMFDTAVRSRMILKGLIVHPVTRAGLQSDRAAMHVPDSLNISGAKSC